MVFHLFRDGAQMAPYHPKQTRTNIEMHAERKPIKIWKNTPNKTGQKFVFTQNTSIVSRDVFLFLLVSSCICVP